MANEQLKALWTAFEQATTLLQKNLKTSYLQAATEAGEDLHLGKIDQIDGLPDAKTTQKLQALFKPIDLKAYTQEELRQALQLALVKAIPVDGIEPNKQVTPDAMASLATFLVVTFYHKLPKTLRAADLAVGSGNLLYAVMNQLKVGADTTVKGYGIDNDETLLAFASMSADLQGLDVSLYHQDALAAPEFEPVDLVVSDLPVGYYPVDERAKTFATAAKTGHSYAHHLMLEQSMKLLVPGGLGLFFVPASLFQTEESKGLTTWLTQSAYFQGLLNLPDSFFEKKANEKALLVIQKPGASAKQAKQVLLGAFPELKEQKEFRAFLDQVRSWAAANIN